jgi:serine protease Do
MKNYYIAILLILTTISCNTLTYGQGFDKASFETTIQKGIAKAYAASVKIWGIDTLTKRQNSAQFTGVVIDAEGYILTAAHAIQPNKRYKVIFPDGKEFTAEGLGRISYEPKTGRPDVAMIKIIEKATWPIAEMGWSNSLKVNEPCISIAYPTTLSQVLPTIRVGRITNPLGQWGFIHSTCKMEPGDSGGPLFDYLGRVIGIHSRIDVAEDVNYEIPVDLYRKYFTALKVAKDYPALPEKEDEVGSDPKANSTQSFVELADLKKQFGDFEKGLKENSLIVKSSLKGRSSQAFGTLFYFDMPKKGSKVKGKSFIVSKNSLVGDSVAIYLGDRKLDAIVVSRNKDNDLILLQLKADLKTGIKLSAIKDEAPTTTTDVGKFLVSVLPSRSNEISVLSSGVFNQPKKFSSGYFGASANFYSRADYLNTNQSGKSG